MSHKFLALVSDDAKPGTEWDQAWAENKPAIIGVGIIIAIFCVIMFVGFGYCIYTLCIMKEEQSEKEQKERERRKKEQAAARSGQRTPKSQVEVQQVNEIRPAPKTPKSQIGVQQVNEARPADQPIRIKLVMKDQEEPAKNVKKAKKKKSTKRDSGSERSEESDRKKKKAKKAHRKKQSKKVVFVEPEPSQAEQDVDVSMTSVKPKSIYQPSRTDMGEEDVPANQTIIREANKYWVSRAQYR